MTPSPDEDEFVDEKKELSTDEADPDEADGRAEVRGEELIDDRAEESTDEGTAERVPAISGDTRLKALPSFFPLPDEEELDEENDELSPVDELEDGDAELRDDCELDDRELDEEELGFNRAIICTFLVEINNREASRITTSARLKPARFDSARRRRPWKP